LPSFVSALSFVLATRNAAFVMAIMQENLIEAQGQMSHWAVDFPVVSEMCVGLNSGLCGLLDYNPGAMAWRQLSALHYSSLGIAANAAVDAGGRSL
jgi:hypothetical protein